MREMLFVLVGTDISAMTHVFPASDLVPFLVKTLSWNLASRVNEVSKPSASNCLIIFSLIHPFAICSQSVPKSPLSVASRNVDLNSSSSER